MDKYIHNEQNGLWYELQGDYYLPCLKLPEDGEVHIGIWGQRHLRYLKQYHRVRYYNLLTSGKLNDYLVDVENWAQQMFDELVNALSRNENLTEGFKATNPVEWVRKSNNIRNRAAEIVNQEVIFSLSSTACGHIPHAVSIYLSRVSDNILCNRTHLLSCKSQNFLEFSIWT